MLTALAFLALVSTLSGAYGQTPIPPSSFDLSGGSSPTPPPPPPPPPSNVTLAFDGVSPSPPPPASTPVPAPVQAPSSVTPAVQSSKGSSSISGGAIAGIVIGVIAGVALLGLLGFFLVRRKRQAAARSNDIEANGLNKNKPSDGYIRKSSNLHDHLGSLNHKPSGLDWKEGDEIKSVSAAAPMAGGLTQRAIIEESLSDVQMGGSEPRPPSTPDVTSSVVQIMPDNTSVVIRKGPGGSIQIQKVASEAGVSSGAPNSQASTISAHSAGTIGSKGSSSVDLPDLPWSDWQLKADDIHFATDEEGVPVKLGAGAYGTVYKATIDGVTECACKVFHDVHNQLQQADILREVAILKSCRDRNIVQFLGACIMDERIMLVTELMEAGDLWNAMQQYKDSGALSWYKRGKRIAVEVARGLHFLHRHKIIHFDLKSPNILLTRDGSAKISDVGFANILSNTHLSNNTTAFTFAWAAPEVLMGRAATEKVDIFSYGVTLWEIVTGLHPQRGQLRDCKVPDECPAEVERLIQQCLSYEPNERPSCKEIVEILNKLEHVQAPTSPSDSSVPPPESNV